MTTPPPPDTPEPPKPPDDIPPSAVPPQYPPPAEPPQYPPPTEPGISGMTPPPGPGAGDMPPGLPGGGYPPGVPPYGAIPSEPADNKGNIFGILALSLGIAAVALSWCCGLGLLAGIPAVVLGVIGMRKADAGEANNKNLAMIGLILGAVGLVISCVVCGISGPSAWDDFQNQMDDY